MAQISINELTEVRIDGDGVFDKLMAAVSRQVAGEYQAGRIKGAEYSTVYLSALQSTLSDAIRFLLDRENAELIQKQIELAEAQRLQTEQETLLVAERIKQVKAETDIQEQQLLNLACEKDKCEAEVDMLEAQTLNVPKEGLLIDARTTLTGHQSANEVLQGEILVVDKANRVIQGTVLTAQECDLRASFDLKVEQTAKVIADKNLVNQRKTTEQGQTDGGAFNATSILGRQSVIYQRQADGFLRDAEQKAAEILSRAWQVDKTTNELETRNGSNKLSDGNVGTAIGKLLAGV